MVKTLHRYPPETLDILLDCGLDFALPDMYGDTPSMHAAQTCCMAGLTALLGLSHLLGRNVALGLGATDLDGRNILHLYAEECEGDDAASQHGYNAALELLLAHPAMDEATANARDIWGHTPLFEALFCGNIDCASTLLESPKVFRGDTDNWGNTPLHCFFKSVIDTVIVGDGPHVDGLLCKLLRWHLLADGTPIVDVFATNDDGLTASDLARQLGNRCRDIRHTLEWTVIQRRRVGKKPRKSLKRRRQA